MLGLRGFVFIALVFIGWSKAADTSYSQRCKDKSVTPVNCNSATHEGFFMKHPDDCALFYYCETPQSEPICVQCPSNQLFNADKRNCDAAYRVNCDRPGDQNPQGKWVCH